MDDARWVGCTNPWSMLDYLRGRASDRKLRLFAVACCRCAWGVLPDNRLREAVLLVERLADGVASKKNLKPARALADEVNRARGSGPVGWREAALMVAAAADTPPRSAARRAAVLLLSLLKKTAQKADPSAGSETPRPPLCDLLRCLFGNPPRNVPVDPAWLTPTVRSLALAIYKSRSFDGLPILGDALEEAGCADDGMLDHLRGPGPHTRGCWAVDVLLAKS